MLNLKYKLISMDFDGTLLTSNKKVTEKTKETLLKYRKNHYPIVGITGRNLSSVKSVLEINLFDYLILCDGAYLFDVNHNELIVSQKIHSKSMLEMTKHFDDIARRIHYCSMENYYIYKDDKIDNRNFLIPLENIEKIPENIGKINIFFNNDTDLEISKEYVKNNFNDLDALVMLDSDDKENKKWLVVNSNGTNKLETLKKLCIKLNISIDEVIFFGDSTNDLSIINGVGLGVAMGNALQEVKQNAKKIALSNDEDGIADFLEKIS